MNYKGLPLSKTLRGPKIISEEKRELSPSSGKFF